MYIKLCFTCESGVTNIVREWKLFLARESLGARLLVFLCVAPLHLEGIRGKKSTLSVGWEVPVKSLWLASKGREGTQDLKASSLHRFLWFMVFYNLNFITLREYCTIDFRVTVESLESLNIKYYVCCQTDNSYSAIFKS